MSTRRPVLVLALDGATFDVIEPLCAAGRLPNLSSWRREGWGCPLASTVPPMSFPAWSTFMTGLSPGQHGLFDFTQKIPGAYRIRFANATHRRGETLFARVSQAGLSCLVLGMPATFPPERVRGLLVSGFDSPVSAGTDEKSASDPALYRRVAERTGPWMEPPPDEGSSAEGWHERTALCLLSRIERKTAFARAALAELRAQGKAPDLGVVVFSESDTVAHHFWRDHDPESPRHDAGASSRRRGAVAAVYEKLDAACGEIRAAFGEEALCLVVSDHGSGGASRRVVHIGSALAERGLLRRSAGGSRSGLAFDRLAGKARDAALRSLPPHIAQGIFRRSRTAAARLESAARFGGIDWKKTAAFSEEVNTQPGVWINLRGREARGSVEAADYERVRDDVIDALYDWKLPGGKAVVARARRREEVYRGPCLSHAPDVVVELALDEGYGLSLVKTPWADLAAGSVHTLDDTQLAGGRGRGMNGTHRPDGVFIATGPGCRAIAPKAGLSLIDVAPIVMDGLGIPGDTRFPCDSGGASGAPEDQRTVEYSAAEEALVAERLRALGYLE